MNRNGIFKHIAAWCGVILGIIGFSSHNTKSEASALPDNSTQVGRIVSLNLTEKMSSESGVGTHNYSNNSEILIGDCEDCNHCPHDPCDAGCGVRG